MLEQYRYSDAAEAFEQVIREWPDWTAAHFNLGLAYLNMQESRGAEDFLQKAKKIFESILAKEKNCPSAHFCLGLLHEHLGQNSEALTHFEAVYQVDPQEPAVAYKYAEALLANGREEEGVKVLEQLVEQDPGFISGIYRLAMQYQRMRQPEKAKPLFERFKQLNAAELAGGTFTIRKVYGSAGKYYLVLGLDSLPIPRQAPQSATFPVFSPEIRTFGDSYAPWTLGTLAVKVPPVGVADLNGDGHLDVAIGVGSELCRMWLNDGKGNLSQQGMLSAGATAVLFADIDNSGQLDMWLAGRGAGRLYRGDSKGQFDEVESVGGSDDHAAVAVCSRLVDIDADGDLDILAFRSAGGSLPVEPADTVAAPMLLVNRRDGAFEDGTQAFGFDGISGLVGACVVEDWDNDADIDVLLLAANDESGLIWMNDRAGKFRWRSLENLGIAARQVVAATAGDPNKDGALDLLVFSRQGTQLYLNQGNLRFVEADAWNEKFRNIRATGGMFGDFDNDGDLDLLIADARQADGTSRPKLLVNLWPQPEFRDLTELRPGHVLEVLEWPGNTSFVAADFTGNGHLDLLFVPAEGRPTLVENITGQGNWIELELIGTRGQDNKSRSNASALGAKIEVKAGDISQRYTLGLPTGPAATAPLRVHVGLGAHATVDWLRVVWPDAVLQAELELAANQRAVIEELQRKVSSCPHLFAWNGERFEFVADFGGKGGLGYWIGPGRYATPQPVEYLPIPRLEPLAGRFVLQILEPLEEVAYVDEVALLAVDHPVGTLIYPNEMMAVNSAPPAFEIFCFDTVLMAHQAVDHLDRDVTDALRMVDRSYAGATQSDPRFAGFAQAHHVTLDFGPELAAWIQQRGRLVLVAHGWVDYAYSSSLAAAFQAGLRLRAPSVAVLRHGRWVELFSEVGYPAGIQHAMTIDLTESLKPGDRYLRLSSNMELYWDKVFIGIDIGGRTSDKALLTLHQLRPTEARLAFFGFPREFSPDGRRPNLLDYSNVDRSAAWKYPRGRYTRYGLVRPLIDETDNAFVVMAPGDQLTVEFAADHLPPCEPNKTRSFILKTVSFCKDMDLWTATSDTVEPLPFHGMSSYPYPPDEVFPESEKLLHLDRVFRTREIRSR